MTDSADPTDLSRRRVVLGGLSAAAAAVLAACGRNGGNDDAAPAAQTASTTVAPATTRPAATPTTPAAPATTAAPAEATTLAPTPECADDDDVTPAQTEGPYFKASSPERTNIRGSASGTKLVLTVVTTDCKPVARALVDFWQADGAGAYDNTSYNFRGHQFTDAQGRYRLEAVVPGLYPGRTRHIHVKVQPAGGRVLTTQLYFPGEARNASDGIYRKELEMAVSDAADGRNATFQFVVNG